MTITIQQKKKPDFTKLNKIRREIFHLLSAFPEGTHAIDLKGVKYHNLEQMKRWLEFANTRKKREAAGIQKYIQVFGSFNPDIMPGNVAAQKLYREIETNGDRANAYLNKAIKVSQRKQ